MKIFKTIFAITIVATIALITYLSFQPAHFLPPEIDSSYEHEFIHGEILEINDSNFIVNSDNEEIEVNQNELNNFNKYKVGDKISIYKLEDKNTGKTTYEVTDYYHQTGLITIFIIFSIVSIIVARKKGITAIASVILSLGLFYLIFLKMITLGYPPITSAITFIGIITLLTVPLIHRFNKKSLSAIIAIIVAYTASLLIAFVFKDIVQIGNTPSEEFRTLGVVFPNIDFAGIIIASLFIGAVGALIDTAISISSAIFENFKENSQKSFKKIYQLGMNVGKDVLGSMINTLLFAYLASALPFLILLSLDRTGTFSEIINMDFIALELTRTFVGAVSLVIIIPLVSILSSYLISKKF